MQTRTQLKEALRFNQDLGDIVLILKEITAANLRHTEKQPPVFPDFKCALEDFFVWLDTLSTNRPHLKNKACLWILMTSDFGFLAGLNSHVASEALSHYDPARGDAFAVVGEKGTQILSQHKIIPVKTFEGLGVKIKAGQIEDMSHYVTELIADGKFGKAVIVYPFYHSVSYQEAQPLQLFPPPAVLEAETQAEPLPVNFRERVFLESSLEKIRTTLIDAWMTLLLRSVFWHSKLSELAARSIHLEETHQDLGKEMQNFQLLYTRQVHEETDRSIREIFASLSLKKKGTGLF